MKPTLQQEEILKTYLTNILKYRETIDEVYDHVLSALESKPKNERFQVVVNQVLNNDFGGGKGLVKIEKQQLQTATQEAFIQVFRYLKADFEFSNIFHTITLFASTYYLTKFLKISSLQFWMIYPIYIIVTLAITWTRKFFVGYYTKDTRKSIRDLVFTKIMSPSFWLFFSWMMFTPVKPSLFQFMLADYPSISAGIFTIYVLYIVSVIRICLDEFKPYFQHN